MIKFNKTDEKGRDSNELNIWDLTALSYGVKMTQVVECGLSFNLTPTYPVIKGFWAKVLQGPVYKLFYISFWSCVCKVNGL